MRWLPLLAVLAGSASAEPRASNPAFIGIRMNDLGIGCQVADVVAGGPAKDAGVRPLDLILAVDGVPLAAAAAQNGGTCTTLLGRIVGHAPGDTVRLDVRRGLDPAAIKVTLSTRAEVLHRRFVGQTLGSATLWDADDARRTFDLDDLRGHTTVIGWFHAETCVGCGAVFDRVRDALRERLHGDDPPQLLAVTAEVKSGGAPALRKVFSSSVQLAVAPQDAVLESELLEPDRIHFLILDARGIVRCVSPVAPDSDDLDAAIDEVLAGVEQQEHASRPRR